MNMLDFIIIALVLFVVLALHIGISLLALLALIFALLAVGRAVRGERIRTPRV